MRVEAASQEPMQQPRQTLHLLYHELRSGRSKYPYVLDPRAFDQHLEMFVQMRNAESHDLRPEVTFDDGHVSNFEYALPSLHSRGLIARFFITVGWTDKRPNYMGWQQLRSLQESGQLIGAHGWSHAFLTRCDQGDLNRELSGARRLLEDKLGTQITTMSLPGGRCNRRVLAACREAGYTQIFTSEPKAEPTPSSLLVGRVNVRRNMTPEQIRALLQYGSGALRKLELQARIKLTAQRALGDGLYEKVWGLLNRKERECGTVEDFSE